MLKKIWSYSGTRFIAVGLTNTVIDFFILNMLVFVGGFNRFVANCISVTIAMIISYLLNKNIVFRQKGENHAKKLMLFFAITAFGLFVLQNLTIYIFVHWFTWPAEVIYGLLDIVGIDSLTKEFVILNTAKIFGTAVNMVWNFFMYKHVVFANDKDLKTPAK